MTVSSNESEGRRHPVTRWDDKKCLDQQLPVHFFTIVLNGEPFIRYHLGVFQSLPFRWHWHIIEGVADLVKDTAWSKALGGKISSRFHLNGRSRDGTDIYLERIAAGYPDRISLYRKPAGKFWDGKLEMVNAPLGGIQEACLLWQVDVDEFWTADALVKMRDLFVKDPQKTAAYFHCHYFLGPLKYVVSMNTWATGPFDWLRVWRYQPGMRWTSHEPPCLVDGRGRNVGLLNPFSRDVTLAKGIVFQHYAYVLESQVRFKESYYGYREAVRLWKRLNGTKGRLRVAEYLPWAGKDAWADDWKAEAGKLLLPAFLADLRRGQQGGDISVCRGGAFEKAVARLVKKVRPRRIIETGTYLGRGTTTIVWQALKNAGIEADFTTIEVNPAYHRRAHQYFQENRMRIKAVLGLSISRSQLPRMEEIQRRFVDQKEAGDIYYDHPDNVRSRKYFAETDFDVPDGRLEEALRDCDFRPDLVLLDSAGHLGFQEFELVRSRLQGPCHLVLDDVHHCKHHRSLKAIKADPRFELLEEDDEKFGFAIARFEPVKCMVFLRTDSIGDSILALPMIAPLVRFFGRPRTIVVCQKSSAPLYRRSPHVDKVIEIPDEHRWKDKHEYAGFLERLRAEKPDLLVNTTYSVHEISDLAGLEFIRRRIAFRNERRVGYTHLLDPGHAALNELQRHARFLEQLGIEEPPVLQPKLVPGKAEMAWAQDWLRANGFDPGRTLALFPASRLAFKDFEKWNQVLETICGRGFKVIALGAEKDRRFADRQLAGLEEKAANLCGRTSLFQAAALLSGVRLAAGCDTSLAHLACSVGTANVVVVGGGHFGRFFPYSPTTTVVCNPLDCFGCNWNCRYSRTHCIKDIDPELVLRAIEDRLERPRGNRPRIFYRHGQTAAGKASTPRPVDCRTVLAATEKMELQPVSPDHGDRAGKPNPAGRFVCRPDPASKFPRITIVTPSFNQGRYLEDCIRSILDQGYPNLEYIIMDGGSTDGSVEIIRKYAHRLAFWKSAPDDGQYAAIEEGFSHGRGQIMTWLNADDILCPGTLFAVAAIFVNRPEVRWITGLPSSLSPDGSLVHVSTSLALWSRRRYLEKKYFSPFIQQEGTFWRRSLWEQAGSQMAKHLQMAGDLELWTRFFRHSRLHSVDLTLAIFRQHAGQKTDGNLKAYFREAEQVLNRELEDLEGQIADDAPLPITNEQVWQYLAAVGGSRKSLETEHRPTCTTAGGKKQVRKDRSDDPPILVSAIVSTYNAERFMAGCLDDLLAQSIADRIEIIVVDSGSEQNEGAIVKSYQRRHSNIRYLRTEQRESVYQAWNRALALARGRYLTSANTDDRHRSDAFEQMVKLLEENSSLALVYADVLVSDRPCCGMEDCLPSGLLRWHDWDRRLLLEKGCFIGPQPMWRRKMHAYFGLFDTNYKVAADYEFWLRISQVFDFYHLGRPMGVYLKRPDSIEHANAGLKKEEELQIVAKYRRAQAGRVLLGCRVFDALTSVEQTAPGEIEAALTRLREMAEQAGRTTPSLLLLEKLSRQDGTAGSRWRAALRQTEIELLKGGKPMQTERQLLEAIEAMTRAGKTEAARWALEKMIQDFPGSAVAHYNLAVLAFDSKDMEQARSSFETAASLAPGNFAIQKQLADFYYVGANDPQKAIQQYQVALELQPDDRQTLITMAHLNVLLERFDQARSYYLKALELEPDDYELRRILSKLEGRHEPGSRSTESYRSAPTVEQLYRKARQEIEAGRKDNALVILEEIAGKFPEFAPAHNDLGVLAYEQGQKDVARKHYQKAVELAPQSPTFHKNLADFYLFEDKRVKEAMEHYLQALKIDPTDIETLLATGNVCLLLGKADDARTFFERVLELEPWNEEARKLIEDSADRFGRQEQIQQRQADSGGGDRQAGQDLQVEAAIASLEQKLLSFPDDATAHNDLGVLYYEAGRKEKAFEHYRKAVELDPYRPTFKKNLADFYFMEMQQPEKSMEIYVELLKNDPRDIEVLAALGQMCRLMGKYDDARRFLSRALEIEPGNQELLQAINQLEDQVAAMAASAGSREGGIRLAAS